MSMPNIPSIQTPPGNPEFVNLDSRYKCIVCHNVLRDAMQTTCGHRLCEGCLPTLFDNKEEPVDCPANEDDCQEQTKSNITIDPGCRREVSRLKVKCSFRNAGCDKQMLWKDLEAHELDCAYRLVVCPNKDQGCAQMIPLANVEKHVNTECTYRLDTCKYCQQRVPLATLEHHVNDVCPSVQLPCPFSCGQPVMSRDELNQHKADCSYKPVECTYKNVGCTFMGTEEQVASHLLNDVNSHLEKVTIYTASMEFQTLETRKEIQALSSERDMLQRQIQEQNAQFEKMKADIEKALAIDKELKIKMVSLTEKHIQTERKVASVPKKEAVDKHEKDIKTLQTTMTQVRAQMSQIESGGGRGTSDEETKRRLNLHDDQFANLDRQMAELDLRFQILETANFDGILLWKLRDYTRRKREAIQGRTLSLYSQPFYTHRFGYKMCARVYLNGDGMGKGTHLSLFFVIMRGEFDNLLTWPFKQKVTMILMDQENGQTPLSDTFIPDTTSSSFKQPSSDMNIASGCPLFVSHTILESPKYLRDDTIFIKVIVDLHNLNPP